MLRKKPSENIKSDEVFPLMALKHVKLRANPNDSLEFTFFLKAKNSARPLPDKEHLFDVESEQVNVISRVLFNRLHRAHETSIDKIKEFAKANNFKVLKVNEIERWVTCTAKISDLERAFSIDIKAVGADYKVYYYYENEIKIPDDLGQVVESISGLHDFPAKVHKIFPKELKLGKSLVTGTAVVPQNFAKLYNFPEGLDGRGQTIAIISLGGGYSRNVLKSYFKRVGIPMPKITWRSVDGARNNTKDDIKHVYEVYMDVEIAGSMAPGAKIVVYFAKNTRAAIAKAIKRAIHDKKNRPTIISMSWGALEKDFKAKEKDTLDRALHEAAALNITVITSTGDLGSSGELLGKDKALNVQLPASSPFVLAVGGTKLHENSGVIVDEHCWEEEQELDGWPVSLKSGGGFSEIWPMPSYQTNAVSTKIGHQNKRGLPDVAANASTEPGFLLFVGKTEQISMGTSAAAPLWAALIARLNQKLNENGLADIGFINPVIYHEEVVKTFNPVDLGDNGAYKAGKGWDPTTGLGTPNGVEFVNAVFDIMRAKNAIK